MSKFKRPARTTCPRCGKFGSPKLAGYCSLCAGKDAGKHAPEHITKSGMIKSYWWNDEPFIKDHYSIIKDKPDIVR